MFKYILSILDALGEVVIGHSNDDAGKHQIKPSSQADDATALQGDWQKIGGDFKKSIHSLIGEHGNQ